MELYIERPRPERNFQTGQFLPGHTPVNKGKPRREWMSKEADQRIRESFRNLLKNKTWQTNGGLPRKAVIMLTDEGRFCVFKDAATAAEKTKLGHSKNIARCCRYNQARHANKFTGEVNTDHRYQGMRWYYEEDNIWTTKI